MSDSISLIALFLLAWPAENGHVEHHRERLGAWTLRVTHDAFADQARCELAAGETRYRPGAVTFHFDTWVDTRNAIYRVDGGPPVEARSNAAALAQLGVAIQEDRLANPSGGLVNVPADQVRAAHAVAIAPAAMRRVVRFKVDGLDAALEAADKAGCTPQSFR